MLKKISIILGSILVLVAVVFGTAFMIIKPSKDRITDFIKENPERAAISLSYGDNKIVEHQADKKLPLASTLKVIIAIEYAYQAAEGKISPSTRSINF